MIIRGDCLHVLALYPDNYFHSVVTDPPYGISFMGKGWDHGVPGIPYWAEVLRTLRPGGYLLAFGGTRTFHRLAVAIEDAGFEIRDCMQWIYGSGFPKSHDISKGIDKAAGVKREKVKASSVGGKIISGSGNTRPWMDDPDHKIDSNIPITPEAQQWVGYGTALKPSWEPIIMARKPLSESTVAANVLRWGTGGLNIDGCRVGSGTQGRWPANTILQHHMDCVQVGTDRVKTGTTNSRKDTGTFAFGDHEKKTNPWVGKDGKEEVERWECHPECPVGMLDAQSGTLKSGEKKPKPTHASGWFGEGATGEYASNSGGASRFFYQAKAGNSERFFLCRTCDVVGNDRKAHDGHEVVSHPTQKPVQLIRYLQRLVTPPGGTTLDPFVGSGTAGVAANAEGFEFIGIDKDPEYVRIAEGRVDRTGKEE